MGSSREAWDLKRLSTWRRIIQSGCGFRRSLWGLRKYWRLDTFGFLSCWVWQGDHLPSPPPDPDGPHDWICLRCWQQIERPTRAPWWWGSRQWEAWEGKSIREETVCRPDKHGECVVHPMCQLTRRTFESRGGAPMGSGSRKSARTRIT